jgi:hypothetical protein
MTFTTIIAPVLSTLLAIAFLTVTGVFKSALDLSLSPGLRFSKGGMRRFNQIPLRWILVFSRLNLEIRKNLLVFIVLSLQVACLAVLPLNGDVGLKVQNPLLVIMTLTMIACTLFVIDSWRAEGGKLSEKSIDKLIFFSSQATLIFILCLGAALGENPGELSDLMGSSWLIVSSPFHLSAFFMGVFLATFYRGTSSKRDRVVSLEVYVDHLFTLLWLTLIALVFLNSSALPGLPHFLFLILKVLFLSATMDVFWRHFPLFRKDQKEKIFLVVLYPVTLISFVGMWWR